MKLETKYDVEQIVYRIQHGKLKEFKIGAVRIEYKYSSRGHEKYVNYYSDIHMAGNPIPEELLYATKEGALRTVVSEEDFEEIIKAAGGRALDNHKPKLGT